MKLFDSPCSVGNSVDMAGLALLVGKVHSEELPQKSSLNPMVGEIPALAGFYLYGQETSYLSYGAFFPLGPSWLWITHPDLSG